MCPEVLGWYGAEERINLSAADATQVAPSTVFFEPSSDGGVFDALGLLLALVAGLFLSRWRDGLFAGAIIELAIVALSIVLPAITLGVEPAWAALSYGMFWVGFFIAWIVWSTALSVVYGLRRLIEQARRA